jgi:hypothetical protein
LLDCIAWTRMVSFSTPLALKIGHFVHRITF